MYSHFTIILVTMGLQLEEEKEVDKKIRSR